MTATRRASRRPLGFSVRARLHSNGAPTPPRCLVNTTRTRKSAKELCEPISICQYSGVSDDDADDWVNAADEPTAMWSPEAAEALGLDALRAEEVQSAPATSGTGNTGRNIQIGAGSAPALGPKKKKKSGPSWGVTIGVALVVGLGVFFLVRMFLR